MQVRNGGTAARMVWGMAAAGLAILPAMLAPASALAGDNCPRLPSSSLVIVIPEGGCDQPGAAENMAAAAAEVTVIRGPGFARVVRKSEDQKVVKAPGGTAAPTVVIVVNNNSAL